jgi:nickel superoxide dismutase
VHIDDILSKDFFINQIKISPYAIKRCRINGLKKKAQVCQKKIVIKFSMMLFFLKLNERCSQMNAMKRVSMRKYLWVIGFALITPYCEIQAHCQMPCGIYHDDMVFDEIDQYVETMYKAVSVLKENKFDTANEKNQFIRWVMTKDEASSAIVERLSQYFLQQKIKPAENDEDTLKKVTTIHKLMFLVVQIKQHVNIEIVKEFKNEWEKLKVLLHGKDYECSIQNMKCGMQKESHQHEDSYQHGNSHPDGHVIPSKK